MSQAVLDAIATAGEGTQIQAVRGAAYLSPDFEHMYFVAMEFSAEGVDTHSGVWATNNVNRPGTIVAVDSFAQAFTDWTDADESAVEISPADPGVAAAESCL